MNILENLDYLGHNYNSFNDFFQNLWYLHNFFNSRVDRYFSLLISVHNLYLSFNVVNSISVLFESVNSYSLLFDGLNLSHLDIIRINLHNFFYFNSNFFDDFLNNGHCDKFVNILFDYFHNLH